MELGHGAETLRRMEGGGGEALWALSLVCDLTLTTPMLRLRGCTWNYMKFVLASAHVRTRCTLARDT